MRLIFIRHAEPDYEHNSLTPKGFREAELLAPRAASWGASAYYVSPLARARLTAEPVLCMTGRTAEVMDWLQEFPARIDDPQGGGRRIPWDLLPAFWTERPDLRDRDLWADDPVMRTGDVRAEADRVTSSFDSLLASHGYVRRGGYYEPVGSNGGTLVFFCHLGVTCVLLAHLLNTSAPVLWHGLYLAPSSVTEAASEERAPGQAYFRLQLVGDTGHLRAAGEPVSASGSFAGAFSG